MKLSSFLFIVISFLSLLSSSETRAQSNDSKTLNLKIKTKIISSPCEKRVLEIDTTLTNTSKQDIVVDKNAIPYEYSVIYFDASGGGKGEGSFNPYVIVSGGGRTTNYFILKSGESYKSKQLIENIELFNVKEDVKFQISVQYRQTLKDSFKGIEVWQGRLSSNSSKFRFKLCKEKKATQI